jgi:Erv1 / Alr family
MIPNFGVVMFLSDPFPNWYLLCSLGSMSFHFGLSLQAAWYPDNPTKREQTLMTNFVRALAKWYPCSYCAADFREHVAAQPVE